MARKSIEGDFFGVIIVGLGALLTASMVLVFLKAIKLEASWIGRVVEYQRKKSA